MGNGRGRKEWRIGEELMTGEWERKEGMGNGRGMNEWGMGEE